MRISDWSSDVCSSDLPGSWLSRRNLAGVDVEVGDADLACHQLVQGGLEQGVEGGALGAVVGELAVDGGDGGGDVALFDFRRQGQAVVAQECAGQRRQIGRASCRERVCQYV